MTNNYRKNRYNFKKDYEIALIIDPSIKYFIDDIKNQNPISIESIIDLYNIHYPNLELIIINSNLPKIIHYAIKLHNVSNLSLKECISDLSNILVEFIYNYNLNEANLIYKRLCTVLNNYIYRYKNYYESYDNIASLSNEIQYNIYNTKIYNSELSNDIIDIINHIKLSDFQKDLLYKKLIEDKNVKDIAEEFQVSKQYIYFQLNLISQKIRDKNDKINILSKYLSNKKEDTVSDNINIYDKKAKELNEIKNKYINDLLNFNYTYPDYNKTVYKNIIDKLDHLYGVSNISLEKCKLIFIQEILNLDNKIIFIFDYIFITDLIVSEFCRFIPNHISELKLPKYVENKFNYIFESNDINIGTVIQSLYDLSFEKVINSNLLSKTDLNIFWRYLLLSNIL